MIYTALTPSGTLPDRGCQGPGAVEQVGSGWREARRKKTVEAPGTDRPVYGGPPARPGNQVKGNLATPS